MNGQTMALEGIEAAKALLGGYLPLASPLATKLPYQPSPEYRPQGRQLQLLFQPGPEPFDGYPISIVSGFDTDGLESDALQDPAVVDRLFDEAAGATLQTLANLAAGHESSPQPRLLERLCLACREELATLLEEHEQLRGAAS